MSKLCERFKFCFKCGKEIKIGDKYIVKNKHFFHKECHNDTIKHIGDLKWT